jgi:iron uptake system component EfeO
MKKLPFALLLTAGLLQTPLSAFAATAPLDLVGPVSD